AARLLLLIRFCGKPRGGRSATLPGIEGRTLLAKLDFFLRYPAYLKKAAEILNKDISGEDLGLVPDDEMRTVESRMVRYLYGPWDHVYYPALAYLIGKELIVIEMKRGTEIFRLTSKGQDIAITLAQEPAYTDLAQRADSTYHLFNRYSGSRLKDFIYHYFPEVVSRGLGAKI
ncbi:MAG: hypothetical protein ACFFCO_11805, partial [Promethearchaeota archaeon]